MRWVRDRYEVMSSRFAEENLAYLPYVASGCSEEILEQATAFFSQPEHQVEGTAVSLEKTTDETAACVSLRRREVDSVVEYLVGLASR
jgi:hypothetical protein